MQVKILNLIPVFMRNVILQDIESSIEGEKETIVILPNKNQIKVVNDVGSFVLHLIDGKRRLIDIVQEVQRTYDASSEQIQNDVVAFIEQLMVKEIIYFIDNQH